MPSAADGTKVLYVLGTQRGGSTVIGRVIGSQPGFAFAGEVRRLWARGVGPGRTCGCGLSFDECPFWSAVLPEVLVDGLTPAQVATWQEEVAPSHRSWRHAERVARAGEPGAEAWPALQHYRTAMARMYAAMGRALGARVVVDSSKLPADAAVLAGIEGVEAYVLHLVRDPRGVVHSQLRRRAPAGGIKPACVARTHRMAAAARLSAAWAVRHAAAGRLARRWPDGRWLRLRYEDFVSQPARALGLVAELVGERPAPLPAGGFDLTEVHTPGGQLPARSGEQLRLDDRWQQELPAPDRTVTTAATLPWIVRFGYPLRPPR